MPLGRARRNRARLRGMASSPPRRSTWRRWAPIATLAACSLAAVGGFSRDALAQRVGAATLIQRGAALFDDQQYEESIQTLSAALVRPGTSQAEKIETYRLLAFNYIILKRTEEADASVRGILVLDETYSLPATESPRFRDFFEATKKKWTDEGKPGKAAEGKPAGEKPIRLQHSSPAETPRNTAIKLTGTVEDPDARVRGVSLAYRTGSKGKFITI